MSYLLQELGITPDMIRRHATIAPVVSVEEIRQAKRERKKGKLAEYHRRYARMRRQANLAKGLTTHGQVRQHRGRITRLEAIEYKTTLDRIRMDGYLAQGLTTNGTPRKIRSKHCPNFVAGGGTGGRAGIIKGRPIGGDSRRPSPVKL